MRSSAFTIAILSLVGSLAQAQIDPSSALLLDSGSRTGVRETGLDSGRYTVRPRNDRKTEDPRAPKSTRTTEPETAEQQQPVQRPVEKAPERTVVEKPVEKSAEKSSERTSEISSEKLDKTSTVVEQSTAAAQPVEPSGPLVAEVRDDRRLSMLELSIAPGYLYNASSSGYSYRNYNTASPTLALDARVWMNRSTAIHTSYLGTLGGSVSDSFSGSRSVSVPQQWFELGFRSRKYFGLTRLSPSLVFGIDWQEYQFRAPADSQTRAKISSSGALFSLEAEVPHSPYRSWTLGFVFSPKLQHKEAATAVEFQSGGGVDANSVGISLGGKLRFDRSNAMFWKLTHTIEKDVFSGDASQPDVLTGVVPSGVTITNSFTLIQLGYTWGD